MTGSESQKQKILYLIRLFFERTDAEHGITLPFVIEYLAERGIKSERKALYRDIKALNDFGFDVGKISHGAHTSYALKTRPLASGELSLMADAVQSSRFLTPEQAESLVGKLSLLAPLHDRPLFEGRVHVAGRVKSKADDVFRTIEVIRRALAEQRRIGYRYCTYDLTGDQVLRHEGKRYSGTPVCLMYVDDLYYLVSFDDEFAELRCYRVDRMVEACVSDEPALHNEAIATFDPEEFEQRTFGMYSGERASVDLLVAEKVIPAIIDRFGADVPIAPAEGAHARVTVRVAKSPVFFSWLAQFGTQVEVLTKSVRAEYRAYLAAIVNAHE